MNYMGRIVQFKRCRKTLLINPYKRKTNVANNFVETFFYTGKINLKITT